MFYIVHLQVVSACHGSVVNVWQVDTGEKAIMFKVAEDEIEITAITFDPTKRRLITGTRAGTVRIWNFNNGACLRELQSADDSEVISFDLAMYLCTFRHCLACVFVCATKRFYVQTII